MKPTVPSSLTKAQATRARRWLSSRVSDLQGLEEENTVTNVADRASERHFPKAGEQR